MTFISSTKPKTPLPTPYPKFDRSPEYWAGWALAYYQWFSAKKLSDIFNRVPFSEILSMYHVFHEMDLTNFVESMEERYNDVFTDTKLKKMREARGLSQHKLSILSGVNLRSI